MQRILFGRADNSVYTPAILLLVCIVGVSFLGLGFIMPLRALYGREVGASSIEIGLMASSFLLTSFLSTPFIGWLSDRFGHGNVLFIGLLVHTLLVLAYIPAQDPILLIGLRAIEGVASASVLPPTRALVNTLAPKNRQGEALGLLSAAQMVGILIGPVVGSLLASVVGYTLSFVIAAAPLLIGAIATRIFLPSRGQEEQKAVAALSSREVFQKLFTRPLIFTYVLQMCMLLSTGIVSALWSLFMLDRGASLPLIGLSYTTFAIPIIFIAPLAGRLSDRFGRYWLFMLGLFLTGISFCLYGFPISPLWIIIISALEGIGAGFIRSPLDGLLADVMPLEIKGQVQSYFSSAGTAGSFIGATVAGFLYVYSPGLPFLLGGILYLALLLVLFLPPLARQFSPPKRETVAVDPVTELPFIETLESSEVQ